jgi:hypothetical protein
VRAAPELLGAPTISGGSAQPPVCGSGGSHKSNKPSKPPRMDENGEKKADFPHLLT